MKGGHSVMLFLFFRIEENRHNPSFNLLPPPPRTPSRSLNTFDSSRFDHEPFVFHITTTTTPKPTVGPEMAELLQVGKCVTV